MFKLKRQSHALTLRVLARLLNYPDAQTLLHLPEMAEALDQEGVLPAARRDEIRQLMDEMLRADRYALEARYVDTFDRGRATSLHLFEHVHGDSRERGQAMVDLLQTYEQAGLAMHAGELPDHLAVVLEFASTQPREQAQSLLREVAHLLNAIFSALLRRQSPYASVVAAALELAGEKPQAVALESELPLDEAWAEPPAFDGCSRGGQARPGESQPIQFVAKARVRNTAGQGV